MHEAARIATDFDYGIVEEAAKQTYIRALCDLPPDVREALKKAYAREKQPRRASRIRCHLQDYRDRRPRTRPSSARTPACPSISSRSARNFRWNGFEIKNRLAEGAKRATLEFPFRGSSTHPLTRVNPQTSVGPGLPVIYFDFTDETDTLDILMAPKGSGSENMSKMQMYYPSHGVKALKKFVVGHGHRKRRQSVSSRHYRRGHRRHRRSGREARQGRDPAAGRAAQPRPGDRQDGSGTRRGHQFHRARPHGIRRRCLDSGGSYRDGLHAHHPESCCR